MESGNYNKWTKNRVAYVVIAVVDELRDINLLQLVQNGDDNSLRST